MNLKCTVPINTAKHKHKSEYQTRTYILCPHSFRIQTDNTLYLQKRTTVFVIFIPISKQLVKFCNKIINLGQSGCINTGSSLSRVWVQYIFTKALYIAKHKKLIIHCPFLPYGITCITCKKSP